MDVLHAERLTERQKAFSRENRYVGPFSLSNISSIEKLRHSVKNLKKEDLLREKRNAHLFSSSIYSLATQTQILRCVSALLLDDDILLWLRQLFRGKSEDQRLSWHVDQINADYRRE